MELIQNTPLVGTPSPFFEGTNLQYAFDSTSLGWWKECPKKYEYSMIHGYTTKSEQVNLLFGIWFHTALETYYKYRQERQILTDGKFLKEQMSHDEALQLVIHDALCNTYYREVDGHPYTGPWQSDHATKTRETLIRSVIWYLDEFGQGDPCKTIILHNGKPAVELSFQLDIGNDLVLCGHLDRLVSFAGENYILDHKTSSSTITNYYFEQYKPDNQMSLYTLAAQSIYKVPAKGVMIDAVQIAVGFSRTTRGFTYRTPAELEEWLNETRLIIEDIHRDARRGYFAHNDKSCHKYGGCPFRKVCGSDPSVREAILKSEYNVKPWNPLQSRS
jgi:PD-(D/E)XK nuclease superfamily